jgi:predicted SAM-dependent methyltransferase
MVNLIMRLIRRRIKRHIVAPYLIKRYLNRDGSKKLNLGAGNCPIEGWLNTDAHPKRWDVAYLDVRKHFPFEDNLFDYILSEHLIEHLTIKEAENMLEESYRVLKRSGKIRISTPDLRKIISLYNNSTDSLDYIKDITKKFIPDLASKEIYRAVFVINNAFYNWGHRFVYDETLLEEMLTKAGFRNLKRYSFLESEEEAFKGIEIHGNSGSSKKICLFESLVMEGLK